MDGLAYDFHAVGDYILSKSTDPADDFEVQTRYVGLNTSFSLNDGVAVRVAGDIVNVFPVQGRFDLIINGQLVSATQAFRQQLPGGGAVQVSNGEATVSWPDRTMVKVIPGGSSVYLSPSRLRKVEGLLGNYDGNLTNELRVKNGPQINPTPAELYAAFQQSWRVALGSTGSLFRRGPDPWNPSFPNPVVTIGDLDPVLVQRARSICSNAGVTHPEVLDTCAFDIVVTGSNSWVNVAVQFDPAILRLTVAPAISYLTPGATGQFAAVVTGTTNRAVNWAATGGSIVASGPNSMTYTAPGTPGQYTVTATSAQNGSAVSTATVIVNTPPSNPSITPTLLTTGGVHACALTLAGQAFCWGRNVDGELGNGSTANSSTPVPVQQGGLSFISLATNYGHFACALTAAGQAYCWGDNSSGQLGTGTTSNSTTPVPVSGGLTFVGLVASLRYACGLTVAGQAYCWGTNDRGALGNGGTLSSFSPMPVQQGAITFVSLTASGDHTCGLTPVGRAYCWGENRTGQLGNGVTSNAPNPTPVPVNQGALTFKSIGAGFVGRPELPGAENTCALTTSGQAYCWGDNSYGELGIGNPSPNPVPVPTPGGISTVPVAVQGGHTFTSLSVGDGFSCGANTAGQVYCWGFNYWGQLGNGTATADFRANPVPTAVTQTGLTFGVISAGANFACALTSAGVAYCWGENTRGTLGNGSNSNSSTPVPVAGGIIFGR